MSELAPERVSSGARADAATSAVGRAAAAWTDCAAAAFVLGSRAEGAVTTEGSLNEEASAAPDNAGVINTGEIPVL